MHQKLRELRKQFDSNSLSTIEMEQLAIVMLDQLPELSSDYLGSTVIQKNCLKTRQISSGILC
ncbi:CGH_1_collapsed_G0015430.mRNA.1.CDS.1 [Saccharomyces cerevisiae]|nr:CGH_1_collapsed_G0015430.mRNA.1.CDS.1 [Saccharomyces cerevisiae]